MTDTLFEVPEQLSPRLRWIKKHGVNTRQDGDRWMAWLGDFEEAIEIGQLFEGKTEDDAIVEMCRENGWRTWQEEEK